MTQASAIMTFMNDDRVQQQIKITQKADASLDSARKEIGMTKVEMLSRVCQWFADQPPMIRKLVLGLVDEELKPTAMRVLVERLALSPPVSTQNPHGLVSAGDEEELEEAAERELDASDKEREATQRRRPRRRAGG